MNTPKLGQQVFVLSDEGEVVRTVVGNVQKNGYGFLNGCDHRTPHWFLIKNAVAEAVRRLEGRKAKLREELRLLDAKAQEIRSEVYQERVIAAPYKVVDLTGESHVRRVRNLRMPDPYLEPGTLVFAAITLSAYAYACETKVYRPYDYYVLETLVTDVFLRPDGSVHYIFSTPLQFTEHFLTQEDATKWLQSHCGPGTLETVPFVSHKREEDELQEDDIPF